MAQMIPPFRHHVAVDGAGMDPDLPRPIPDLSRHVAVDGAGVSSRACSSGTEETITFAPCSFKKQPGPESPS